ncbi:MAG: hypothetical protein ACTS80_00775 [Candidatus Hodgkinia cicadicola]
MRNVLNGGNDVCNGNEAFGLRRLTDWRALSSRKSREFRQSRKWLPKSLTFRLEVSLVRNWIKLILKINLLMKV